MNNSAMKRMLPVALVAAAMSTMVGGMPTAGNPFGARGPTPRPRNPWDDEHLSKHERRGKTYEEIQAMRKTKWESKQKAGE